jgi:hypothetical protein
MHRLVGAAAVAIALAASTLFSSSSAFAAKHEQVVFSGEADGVFGSTSTDVGFWIWCIVDEAGSYDDCSGAIAIDELHLTKHVEGDVAEIDDDVYQMDVASSDGSVACTLTNTPPIAQGPSNRVDISCTSPSGSASTTGAVVVATG